jgi:phosphate transport system substrate-binding protein
MRLLYFFILFLTGMQTALADEVLFRMHGSNTIGAKLGPALVRGWLLKNGNTGVHISKQSAEEIRVLSRNKAGEQQVVEIKSHGSSTSFKALKKGLADVGMSSRPIKVKENNILKKFGEMSRRDAEYVIGLDGIAVIVNPQNPLKQLDKSVIRKIFTGQITRWSEVDKAMSGKIQVYARDSKSGTFDTFKALVMGKKARLVSHAKRYESNDGLSDDVFADIRGIGFVGLPSVRRAKALAISEPGTVAKKPQAFDVATEDYALARRLFMYVPDINANKYTRSFMQFVISESGQKIVDTTGFISQNLKLQPVELNDGFPEEYIKITSEGERLSLNFRFKKGTIKPDNKAMRDIDRLVEFLAKKENRKRKVMLFGFSDSSESYPAFSLNLSTYRVDWVSDLLVQNGIDPVRVRAYGDAIPVASNEDAGGRHKNRRVEVWLQ